MLIFRAGSERSFHGSTRNGVTSKSYDNSFESFKFEEPFSYPGIVNL